MISFWIICALLLALALLFIVLPLWRNRQNSNAIERNAANLEIFRDQIAEMDADLRNGLLTPELYEQGKRELQARLLDEVGDSQAAQAVLARNPLKMLAILLSVAVPLAVAGLYWKLGNPNAVLPQASQGSMEGFGGMRSAVAITALEKKLADNPDSPEGWYLLARSYSEQERFADAAAAFDKLTKLVPNDAQLWADYADVLAMVHEQSLAGAPTKLLNKALELDPNNGKALALSGSAAMERGDYAAAVGHWEKLRKLIPNDTEDAKLVDSGIQQARAFMQMKNGKAAPKLTQQAPVEKQAAVPAGGKERITGSVTLSNALQSQAGPDDTVFVLVRAAEGPKMPLAIIRKQVRDLPLKFALDDSMAMSPQMKMSNFDQVVVIARISKSGQATPQPGDMQGMSTTLKPGSQGVKLIIDTVVK